VPSPNILRNKFGKVNANKKSLSEYRCAKDRKKENIPD